MKSIFTFFGFILIALQSDGQINLVPNPSFEDTISCPTGGSAIDLSIGWSSYLGSPDYFNSCNSSFISVPNNFAGQQFAKDGNAYSGIFCYYSPFNDIREFLGTELTEFLIVGQKYYLSFYTSMGFHIPNNRIGIGLNKLGIKFSTVPYSSTNPASINNSAIVYTNSIIIDSTNWIKISGSFIADSAYKYLIIGNFFTDSACTISILDSMAIYSYYYIDQITLSTDSALVYSTSELNKKVSIYIHPNPAYDEIEISGDKIESLYITNLLGELIYKNTNINIWPLKVNLSFLGKGVYFLNSLKSNLLFSNKIIIY